MPYIAVTISSPMSTAGKRQRQLQLDSVALGAVDVAGQHR